MEKPRLILIAPSLPPARGGVADHACHLARLLAPHAALTIVASQGSEAPPGLEQLVKPCVQDWTGVRSWRNQLFRLSEGATVIWEYVPHLFGRGGFNIGLHRVFSDLRARGVRQILMAHEIAAPLSPWPHRLAYALHHRRQWAAICRAVDSIGISTETWLIQSRRSRPAFAEKFWLAPSPSNLPFQPLAPGEAAAQRLGLSLPAAGLVAGYFGETDAPKRIDWVLRAWERAQRPGRPVACVTVGRHPPLEVPDRLRALVHQSGYLPGTEASKRLQICDLLLFPYIDGTSERRTTFMAGLQHGVPIVSTLGDNSGPRMRTGGFFAACDGRDPAGFDATVQALLDDPARRAALGQAGKAVYEAEFDWPILLERLLSKIRF